MTEAEGKQLKPGEAVTYQGRLRGTVLQNGTHAVQIKWDDRQTGWVRHSNMHIIQHGDTRSKGRYDDAL